MRFSGTQQTSNKRYWKWKNTIQSVPIKINKVEATRIMSVLFHLKKASPKIRLLKFPFPKYSNKRWPRGSLYKKSEEKYMKFVNFEGSSTSTSHASTPVQQTTVPQEEIGLETGGFTLCAGQGTFWCVVLVLGQVAIIVFGCVHSSSDWRSFCTYSPHILMSFLYSSSNHLHSFCACKNILSSHNMLWSLYSIKASCIGLARKVKTNKFMLLAETIFFYYKIPNCL